MATTPGCCTCQRSTTCAGVLPCAGGDLAITTGSDTSAARPSGRIGGEGEAVPAAGRQHRRLVEIGVVLALVGDERLARQRHRLVEQRDREVGDADMAGEPGALALGTAPRSLPRSGMAALGQWIRRRSTASSREPPQARLRRALEIAGGEIVRPDLGGDEDLVARHAAGAEPGADRLLVAVHRGRVDVAVAGLERPSHRLGALLVPQGARCRGRWPGWRRRWRGREGRWS